MGDTYNVGDEATDMGDNVKEVMRLGNLFCFSV